jgi:hypothetical protein
LELTKAELLLLKLIHLFAREVLLVKKLEIKETKTTLYSTFKTDTVKPVDKERFDKEQIGVKEPFLLTNCQFTS